MSGCFGSHPIDQWMEKQLDKYLESTDPEEIPSQEDLDEVDEEVNPETVRFWNRRKKCKPQKP